MLGDEILTEDAEMIFNFKMDISGIKSILWQIARAQEKDTRKDTRVEVGKYLSDGYLSEWRLNRLREALANGKMP